MLVKMFSLLILLKQISEVVVTEKIPITLAGFADIHLTSDEGWSSAGVIPAIMMALDDVNARDDILRDYELKINLADSKCDMGHAINQFYRQIRWPPTKILVLGAGCSASTTPIARISPYFFLTQVAYSLASPELFSRKEFKTLYRTSPTNLSLNRPIAGLLLHFNWRNVAMIIENEPNFSSTSEILREFLANVNITVLTMESFSSNTEIHLTNIKKKDARIIIFNGYEKSARRTLCEAYKQNMFGKKYQWILPGWYNAAWRDNEDTDCTKAQIYEVTDLAFVTNFLSQDISGLPTISNMTYLQYEERYKNSNLTQLHKTNPYHPYGYDSVWAIALALNHSLIEINKLTHTEEVNGIDVIRPKGLQDFTYNDSRMAIAIAKAFQSIKFRGVSGEVSYSSTGNRRSIIRISQFQNLTTVPFALYFEGSTDATSNMQFFNDVKWHGTGPPSDSISHILSKIYLSYLLLMFICVISGLGVVLAVGFLTFNIRHMHYRHIKMSSPRLNNLIVLGCILGYISAVIFGIDGNIVDREMLHVICSAKCWTLSAAFTCAFGAMFAKIWRVHAIFTARIVQSKALQDIHLFAFIGVLFFIDVTILTCWHVVDPFFLGVRKEVEDTDTVIITRELEYCNSEHKLYWLGGIYAVKGLLLIFGCFLAYETRHVQIPGLNDSRYIGMCVYNVVALCIVGVTITFAVDNRIDVDVAFTAFCVIFCSTVTLCLLFIPKVHQLRLDRRDACLRYQKENRTSLPSGSTSTFEYTVKEMQRKQRDSQSENIFGQNEECHTNKEAGLMQMLTQKDNQIDEMKREIGRLEATVQRLKQMRNVTRRVNDTITTSTIRHVVEHAAPGVRDPYSNFILY